MDVDACFTGWDGAICKSFRKESLHRLSDLFRQPQSDPNAKRTGLNFGPANRRNILFDHGHPRQFRPPEGETDRALA